MAARTPHGKVLCQVLADGAWHDHQQVVEAMMPAVPPGVAFRHAERRRAAKARTTGTARARTVGDETTAVAAGARSLSTRLIRARRVDGSLEERTVDGRRQIRRAP